MMKGFKLSYPRHSLCEKGQSIVEYALILSFVAVVATVLLLHDSDIGNSIANTISSLAEKFI